MSAERETGSLRGSPVVVLQACIVLAVLLGLALIPGYFSFDELQWLAYAQRQPVPWQGWWRFDTAQYRPLTFNLWLLIARTAGDVPWRLHALWAVAAAGNAFLLWRVARSFGVPPTRARWAVLAFLLSPYAMFTHAWVGTLADLLVLAAALLAVLWLRRESRLSAVPDVFVAVVVICGLQLLALASKESAIMLPVLMAAAAWRHPRPLRPLLAALAATLCVAAYLWLRLGPILHLPQQAGMYTWSLANVPLNVLRYLVFVFDLPRLEVHGELAGWSRSLPFAAALAALLLWALARAGRRWFLGFLALLALPGPALILDGPANQYAYVAIAAACVFLSLAAARLGGMAHRVLVLAALVSSLHGVWIGARMFGIGRIQQNLHADLLVELERAPNLPLRVTAQRAAEQWLPRRLLHAVPSYRGVPIGDRVEAVEPGQPADLLMAPDGHLLPVQAPARLK